MLRLLIMTMCIQISAVQAQPIKSSLDALLSAHYPDRAAPGGMVMIKQEGQTLYAQGFGQRSLEQPSAIDQYSQFRMASVSKQFTAMAIYQLQKAGLLTLDEPIAHFFPSLASPVNKITVRQLIQHSSGIIDYEPKLPQDLKVPLSDHDVLKLIASTDSTYFTPGTAFRYSNTGYCLLSLIVEQRTGMDYGSYVEGHIFKNLNIDDARVYAKSKEIAHRAYGYHPVNNGFNFADQSMTSATLGDGGVYISAEGYHTWLSQQHPGALVDAAYLAFLEEEKFPVKAGVFYSMGWFVAEEADGTSCLFHSGESTGFHNFVYWQPTIGFQLSLFTNRDDLVISDFLAELQGLVASQGHMTLKTDKPLFKWLSSVYMGN